VASFTSGIFHAGQYTQATLNKGRTGFQIHTALLSVESLSVCSSVEYDAYIVIGYIIHEYISLRIFCSFYGTGYKI
jgi:hypothetical protein